MFCLSKLYIKQRFFEKILIKTSRTQVIQNIRKKKSSSLNDIAFKRGGVTSATLSRIENGLVDFKFSTLLNLAHTLDISLIELFENYTFTNNEDS